MIAQVRTIKTLILFKAESFLGQRTPKIQNSPRQSRTVGHFEELGLGPDAGGPKQILSYLYGVYMPTEKTAEMRILRTESKDTAEPCGK